MDAALIGIAGTLLGGLLGGLLTYWNSSALSKRERNWQVVRVRQEKLELIAMLLDEIQNHYTHSMGEVFLKVESGKPFSESDTRIPYGRLKILIQFYAPEMLEDWSKLEEGQEKFGKVLLDAIENTQRSKSEKQELNGRAVLAERYISMVCRALSAKAAQLANEEIKTQTTN